MFERLEIEPSYSSTSRAVMAPGDCVETLRTLPDGFAKLIITSPPYNLGKEYETASGIEEYLQGMTATIEELVRVLADDGSLCGQAGDWLVQPDGFREATRRG
jgi:adenine-specific DNA-methyltransferase